MSAEPVEVHFTLDNGDDILYEVDSVEDGIELIQAVFAGREMLFMEADDDDPDEDTNLIHTYYYPVHRIKDAGFSVVKQAND